MTSEDSGMFSGWYDMSSRPKHQHRGIAPTAQIDWELGELIGIYDSIHPRYVLEIGSQWGGTLWHWLLDADPGTIVCNIDILQSMTEKQGNNLLVKWAGWPPYGVVLHSIIGRSDEQRVIDAVQKYLPDGIDFLFIDALHTYEGAKHDFETYGPMVRPGGVIALHDLVTPEYSPHIRVCDLWDEIRHAGYKVQELRAGGDFGGIGIVYV
jgi:predicted O-methyltransferase YrrM